MTASRAFISSAWNLKQRYSPSLSSPSSAWMSPLSEETEQARSEFMSACDRFVKEQEKQWAAPDSDSNGASLQDAKNDVLSLVDKMASLNPSPLPLEHWGSDRGGECMLDGMWKVRFTTALDATIKPGRRGPATITQRVNATAGTFTNIIEFRENKGTVKSFNVIVEGEQLPESDTKLALAFKRVVTNRQPRGFLGKLLFKRISVPLPPLPSFGKQPRPGFETLYTDEELRIQRTTQGEIFVQSRLYDFWDPAAPQGWTLVSAV